MLPFFVVATHALSWCCRKWALLNKSVFHHSRWLYGIILGLLLHSQHTMLEKIFQLFPLLSAVFPVNKNSVRIKNNKIVINNRQILTLFYS